MTETAPILKNKLETKSRFGWEMGEAAPFWPANLKKTSLLGRKVQATAECLIEQSLFGYDMTETAPILKYKLETKSRFGWEMDEAAPIWPENLKKQSLLGVRVRAEAETRKSYQ